MKFMTGGIKIMNFKKMYSLVGKVLIIVVISLFGLVCLFGILFFAGVWYKENFM